MGRAIDAYLILNRALGGRTKAQRRISERVFRLFGLLSPEQRERLEKGVQLNDEEQNSLAIALNEEPDLVALDLSNFLFWRGRSPQVVNPNEDASA